MVVTLSMLAEAAHGAAEEHGPTLLGLDAEGWVYVGLTIFILLAIFVAKAPKVVTDVLDARIAETRRNLDEAQNLRAEAEQLLASAKTKIAASAGDAAAIIAHAEAEAKQMLADAEVRAHELTERRTKMAEDRIDAAERSAIADLRTRATDAAATIAEKVIAAHHDAATDKALVDSAIARMN